MFWLRVMTKKANWWDDRNALYVIDFICQDAIRNEGCYKKVKEHFKALHEERLSKSSSGYLTWLTSRNTAVTFLPYASSTIEFAYFSFFVLELEEDYVDAREFWLSLVEELRIDETRPAQISLEQAAKNVAKKNDVACFNTNFLSVYRWSQAVKDTPREHPMMVVFVQKFFSYFLARPIPDKL